MKTQFLVLFILSSSMLLAISGNNDLGHPSSPCKIIQQTAHYLDIEFTLPSYQLESKEIEGVKFQKIVYENAGQLLQPGMPDVPSYSINIAIPYHGSVTTEILGTEKIQLQSFNPYPQQDIKNDRSSTFCINHDYYKHGGIYPTQKILISDPKILREMRIVNVKFNPYTYDARTKSLTIDNKIQVRFHFTASKGVNEMVAPSTITPSFDPIYKAQVLNYNVDRDVDLPYSTERILIIYPYTTDSTFLTRLDNLIDWKKQKGYLVTVQMLPSTPTPTSTSVKDIIQAAYNNVSARPTYVILIGDVSGTYIIPTWIHGWTATQSYSGEGDYPYTLLAGNDLLGDLLIGRISISNTTDFLTMTGKGFLYERDINISTASWLNRLLLVGDPSSSGISTIYNNKHIKELAAFHNPSYTYNEVYSAPFPSQINSNINLGTGFFNYRGYMGMSGWSPSTSLVNGYKLPHAVIITCSTGDFTATSTAESLTRLGTESTPKGSVTAIGMATSGLHTIFSNVLDAGIFEGLFQYDMHTMGQALLNGKLDLYRMYYAEMPTLTEAHQHICNLIGDPTIEAFTGIPNILTIVAPSNIPAGTNQVLIQVKDASDFPVQNAIVTCYKRGVVHVTGFTDAEGKFLAFIPPTLSGSITVTVSKQNYKPLVTTITINSNGTLVFESQTIDDDSVPPSNGNGDGIVNAGETIELQVNVRNTTTNQLGAVNGILTSLTPGVTILNSTVTYGDINAGSTASGATKYLFRLFNNVPDNTLINLKINFSDSSNGRYSFSIQLISRNGDIDISNINLPDGNNGVLDPGESTHLILTIQNNGQIPISNLWAKLRPVSSMITVRDSIAFFGTLNNGATATCNTNFFGIRGRDTLVPGMLIPMNVYFYNASGYSETETITMSIGIIQVTDRTGPDIFGHYIYDMGDVNYADVPYYSWVEVATPAGGLGTQVALSDVGTTSDEGDQSATTITTVTMPFTFNFYGRSYSQASICSNGFISIGASADGEFRNDTLPGVLGPNPMIAAFWDDLSLPAGSGVYQYFDSILHYWVVEWYQAKNGYDQISEETFQVILYDPLYYPTVNGEGIIKLQYKVFNNIDVGEPLAFAPTHGKYATIGIKDHSDTDGIQYTFNNVYPISAAALGNMSALLISPPIIHANAFLTISNFTILDGNNGIAEPNENVQIGISLKNMGQQIAYDVSATISSSDPYISFLSPTSVYADITPSQVMWGFSYYQVHIASDCPDGHAISIAVDVSCTDGTLLRSIIIYVVKSNFVYDSFYLNDQDGNNNSIPDSNESILLVINTNNTGSIDISNVNMELSTTSPDVTLVDSTLQCGTAVAGMKLQKAFRVNLGGIPVGTGVTFNLVITGTNITPINQTMVIMIGLPCGMTTDFEANNGGFTTNIPTISPGWQWGMTTKFAGNTSNLWGTDLISNYPANASWDLFSPLITIGSNASLSFWHYYLMEANYDGGVVYISTDGGNNWSIISPNGGYPCTSNHLEVSPAYSCSYPTPSTGISGNATFDLNAFAGHNVIFKWHFFSDSSVNYTGWLIDNIVVSSTTKIGKITGTILLSPNSPNFLNTIVKADNYATQPSADSTYNIYLPNGTYSVTASLSNYSTPSAQIMTISDENPTSIGNFFLESLISPPTLTYEPVPGLVPLSWESRNDRLIHFNHYNVWRKINAESYHTIAEVSLSNYTDTPSVNGEYSYYVTTCYDEGESAPSNTVMYTCTIPTNVSVSKTDNGMEISWSWVPDAIIYRIYRVNDLQNTVWGDPIAVIEAPITSWEDTSPILSHRYYRVTAETASDLAKRN